jgi:2-hydroxychromene-2-carboxylate isomerase
LAIAALQAAGVRSIVTQALAWAKESGAFGARACNVSRRRLGLKLAHPRSVPWRESVRIRELRFDRRERVLGFAHVVVLAQFAVTHSVGKIDNQS